MNFKRMFMIFISLALVLAMVQYAAPARAASSSVTARAVSKSYNSIKITWSAVKGASSCKIYRSGAKAGKYSYIYSAKAGTTSYTDKKLKNNKRYYYQLKIEGSSSAAGAADVVCSAAVSAKPVLAVPTNFKAVGYGAYNKAKITWSRSSGASAYRIYRASSKNGRYSYIKKASPSATKYINTSGLTKKGVYYYKIRAVKQTQSKTYYSAYSACDAAAVKYRITGSSTVTAAQLAAYYERSGHTYPAYYKKTDAPTLNSFCQMYITEASAEGIRPEAAFCQAMLETGWLTFRGDVSIKQNNFAGIGAVGSSAAGNTFASVQLGIRAQVQHLKAYAGTSPLINSCVDPRFKYVKRGCAAYVEWLGMKENPSGQGWAATAGYGYSLVKMIKSI